MNRINDNDETKMRSKGLLDLRNVVTLKVVNRDYKASFSHDTNQHIHNESLSKDGNIIKDLECKEAIKVAYSYGQWYDICTGTECRIPLQIHEFNEVRQNRRIY